MGEDSIPRETPLPRIVPRKLGQGANFILTRGFIAPFDDHQIKKYIRSHFPIWKLYNYRSRQRAYQLAKEVPDLAYRPMLLERLPDLIGSNDHSIELYDLYDILVEGWIKREENWIGATNLRAVSLELALYIYRKSLTESPRISYDEVGEIARNALGTNPEWDHLHSRSLLNRDSQGRFKFAHRSILEFLVVRLAVEGDDRSLSLPWTPFMKELLVSWGHARNDVASAERAKAVLASEDGRKNVSPLFDMWTAPPAFGLPDFKRVAERRVAYNGDRLAPHTWRSSSITLTKSKKEETWKITDEEFNIF